MTDAELLPVLLAQEQRLIFDRFDEQTAWDLGAAMRQSASTAGLPIVISVRRNGQRLFHAALPGTASDNDAWIERKSAVVDRYGHSSYYVGCQFRARGGSFDEGARLDLDRFAAHGGAFPLTVRGAGVIGTIAVSGLPQVDDHAFVVAELERFLW
ncbi:MAG TPA: heme-degrading domain-containing protein [Micromonosporaceae bacterium]